MEASVMVAEVKLEGMTCHGQSMHSLELLAVVILFYILWNPIGKAVLYGWKSGTLLIKKRYFSGRKVPLFDGHCYICLNMR